LFLINLLINQSIKNGFGDAKLLQRIYESRKKNVTIAYQGDTERVVADGNEHRTDANKAQLMQINNW